MRLVRGKIVSNRAHRIYENDLKPIILSMEMLSRITKDKALPYPECIPLLYKIARRYSQDPERTAKALASDFEFFGLCYVLNGRVAEWDKYRDAKIEMDEHKRHTLEIKRLVISGIEKSRERKRQCELCFKWDTFRKVSYRGDVHGWDSDEWNGLTIKQTLCTSCWNKVKPIAKAKKEANELRLLQSRLTRGMQKWQRLQKQAN